MRFEGGRALDAALRKLKTSTARGVTRRALITAIEPMRERAASLAPDDPTTPAPDLHSSIEAGSKVTKPGKLAAQAGLGPKAVVVAMGPTKEGTPHALFQEFGTDHHGPQPFMRPAFDAEARPTIERVGTELWSEIDKTAKRIAKRAG